MPEKGFLRYRWNTYSEHMIMYILGIGSQTHPISADCWYRWKLPLVNVGGYTYVGGGPLFIHQYPQAWLDLRNRGARADGTLPAITPTVDYFANSVAATRAQQALFSGNLAREFPGYSANVWGVTASDSSHGYTDWGG